MLSSLLTPQDGSSPSRKRRKLRGKRAVAGIASKADSNESAAAAESRLLAHHTHHPEAVCWDGRERGGSVGAPVVEIFDDDDVATWNELVIDVIPTSASKRSHPASVALRGTADNKASS